MISHKQYILDSLFTKTGKLNSAIIRRDKFLTSPEFCDMKSQINFASSPSEIIYCYMNNISTQPTCKFCNSVVQFQTYSSGYHKTCNKNSCKRKNKSSWKSSSKTKKSANKKIHEAFICAYVSGAYTHKPYISFIDGRITKTRGGTKSRFILESHKKNNIDILCSIIKDTEQTLQFDANDLHWSERFYILKHGTHACQICGAKTKYRNYKYGYSKSCPACFVEYNGKVRNDNMYDDIIDLLKSQGFTLLTPKESFNGLNNTRLRLHCDKCNTIITPLLNNGKIGDIYCSGCYGDKGISKEEQEVKDFIQALDVGIEENVTDVIYPKELDIYIPVHKFAIEYNGLFYHSFGITAGIMNNHKKENVNRTNHLDKTKLCNDKAVSLYHIFSNEWKNPLKRKIWKSMISSKLGKSKRLYARKCSVTEDIPTADKNKFLINNHLQGKDISSVCVSLMHDGKLVSIMTFSKSRYDKKIEWELVRYCGLCGYNVIGGAGKLLSYFEKHYNPKSIISYANLRYSNGNLYDKLGFEYTHTSPPNYFYYKGNEIKSRMECQKHKLSKILPTFDSSLSEHHNMFLNGYRRIWDCGNLVFIKNNY